MRFFCIRISIIVIKLLVMLKIVVDYVIIFGRFRKKLIILFFREIETWVYLLDWKRLNVILFIF